MSKITQALKFFISRKMIYNWYLMTRIIKTYFNLCYTLFSNIILFTDFKTIVSSLMNIPLPIEA
ncbi:unnamed protein product [Pneumocystis jirovecii]|uniref:Uncharacterized protein n=1 Tax=Pneumocystis jirovecii TaxID=42068 RepID=L0PEG4_PNEJI|nr:unnamed protein product [Pneumocystis jirovecii]